MGTKLSRVHGLLKEHIFENSGDQVNENYTAKQGKTALKSDSHIHKSLWYSAEHLLIDAYENPPELKKELLIRNKLSPRRFSHITGPKNMFH